MSIQHRRFCLQTKIFELLYSLFDKGCADLFKYPVDQAQCPEYASKIERPIDLSTIGEKYKLGEYRSLEEIDKDIKQIIKNCCQYCKGSSQIMGQARKFDLERKAFKDNLKKCLEKYHIASSKKITLTQQHILFMKELEDKRKREKKELFQGIHTKKEPSQKQEMEEKEIVQEQKQQEMKMIQEQIFPAEPPKKEENRKDSVEEKVQKKIRQKKITRTMMKFEQMEKQRQQEEEQRKRIAMIREQDQYFIEQYSKRSNKLIIEKYDAQKLRLNWEKRLLCQGKSQLDAV